MGPEKTPLSDMLVYSFASACAARSVHCSSGVVVTRFTPRLRKFDPAGVDRFRFPPLKPPRETSNGDVLRLVEIAASRGRELPFVGRPLRVTLLSSASRPST